MKSLSFLIGLLLTFTGYTYGQQSQPLIAKVTYHFIHQYDKSDTSKTFDTDMLLLIGKDASRYAHGRYQNTEPLPDFVAAPKIAPETIKAAPVVQTTPKARINLMSKAIGTEFRYRVPAKNQLVLISTLGYRDYRIEEKAPEINWEMSGESKMFGGVECQKAIGSYGGRKYTVWFAPSLPFSYGPWKLGGLPGLILDAVDETGTVRFSFKSFVKANDGEVLHFEELRPIKLSEEKYLKEKEKFEKDPIALSKAQLSSDTQITRITLEQTDGKVLRGDAAIEAIKAETQIVITNPLIIGKAK